MVVLRKPRLIKGGSGFAVLQIARLFLSQLSYSHDKSSIWRIRHQVFRQAGFQRGVHHFKSMRNGTYANDGRSSSTSMSNPQEVEDDRMIAAVLSEEYANLDGTVGQRLTNLAPVHHVPRINSHVPTLSESTLDYQRLLQRLNVYGLYEVKVYGDGNCQFRALSDQIYRSPEYHKHVRKEVVKQLKDNHALYEGYVPMKFKCYHKKMARSGEWGDHVTLQAASDKVEDFLLQ